jgi:hypothetical protein
MSTELGERVDRPESVLGHFIVQTDTIIRQIEEDRRRMNKQWGELANKMGTLVEDIVAPNIQRIAMEHFGCGDIEDFMVRRIKRHVTDKTKRREFDVIAVCEDKVILNETKSTPRQNYIDDFVDFIRSKTFYGYFPEFNGKELIPVFAVLYLPYDVVEYLTKNKIYAMGMKDDTMDILNYPFS